MRDGAPPRRFDVLDGLVRGGTALVADRSSVLPPVRRPLWRTVATFVLAFAATTALASLVLSAIMPVRPVPVYVRWNAEVQVDERGTLERQFQLTSGEATRANAWKYWLTDPSSATLRGLVQHPRVEDTHLIDRVNFRPPLSYDRSRRITAMSLIFGVIASLFAVLLPRLTLTDPRLWAARDRSTGRTAPRSHSWPATVVVVLAGLVTTGAMTSLAAAPLLSAATALLVVYASGYVVGSLLVETNEQSSVSWSVIRVVAGLLLTTVGFLLSLVLSLPWWVMPSGLVVCALALRGWGAVSVPATSIRFRWGAFAAGILAVVLLSPIVISTFFMAPGRFPPVFYNVDTGYFLEKVHALTVATSYPPQSLSNVGGVRAYHFGTHAMAALISRGSGLPPHQSLFLILLPVLTAGVIAAAFAAARYLSPALPRSVTVPLLLISTPSLSFTFWDKFGPRLWAAATSADLSFDELIGEYALWGLLSNEAQNVGSDFLLLASVAGIVAAPVHGWRLPAFLVGSGILIKTPAGVALLAGFVLAEAWHALMAKRIRPSPQLLIVAGVFSATYVVFWILAWVEPDFRVQPFPLFHLRRIVESRSLGGFMVDVLWLFLPVLIVLTASIKDPERRSAPILMLAIGALLVVNATRMIDVRPGQGGADEDWLQVLHSVPILLHAFALSLASRRWDRLGPGRRAAFLAAMAFVIVPVTAVAARYSVVLLSNPENGHEFVDNRPLAEALAVVPVSGSIIVTNDLRYPTEDFTRDNRQMQIPALFGHQAFAVNYAYEVYPFSRERRELQKLLQSPEWSDAIAEAARTYHWTHLLIRKDYVHPTPIPLERIFENHLYAVFRFP